MDYDEHDPDAPQILVPDSPLGAQLLGALRTLLLTVGAGWVTSGLITQDQQNAVVGAIVTIVTVGWQQYAIHHRHAKMKTLADAAPDTVGKVVRK